MEANKLLIPAIRQYKHNNGSEGFVFAYERDSVDMIVEALEAELARVKSALKKAVDDWDSDVAPIGIIDDLERALCERKG